MNKNALFISVPRPTSGFLHSAAGGADGRVGGGHGGGPQRRLLGRLQRLHHHLHHRRAHDAHTLGNCMTKNFRRISPWNNGKEVPALGFVYRFAAVYGFGKPGKSAAAAAVTLTTQGEMCHY